MTKSTWVLAFALWGCTTFAAQAGFNPAANTEPQNTDLIIRALNPDVGLQRFHQGHRRASIEIIQLAATRYYAVDVSHSYEFCLDFAPKVSVLSETAKHRLIPLGFALRGEALRDHSYLIGVHTDVRGDESYNDQLTQFRALAIKQFLVTEFAINPHRLIVFGWGERKLKQPHKPLSSANRRVEISLVTDDLRLATPEQAIPLWSFNEGFQKKFVSSALIARNFPNLKINNFVMNAAMRAGKDMTCADKVAHDPRPLSHKLDDFNTGRTPLKCEREQQSAFKGAVRLKIR